MNRTAAVRRAGLAIVVAGLLGVADAGAVVGPAPAAHARDGSDLELRVTGEGVAFDGRVSGDVWLQYTVHPPGGDDVRGFGHRVSRSEQRSRWVPFEEAAARFPGGYCVAWLQLENTQWGSWRQDEPVCWLPKTAEGDTSKPESDSGNGNSGSSPEKSDQDSKDTPSQAPPGPSDQESEESEPEVTEPDPTTTPSPVVSASPSPSASASPSVESSAPARGDDGSLLFARPATGSLPPDRSESVDLTWLWVVLGGFAAASGGVVIMMMRRDY